jgi:hypothetical protein
MKELTVHSRKSSEAVAITRAVLGFRAHSGWAALVAVAGPARSPEVIDRRRIELADPEVPRPVQPYHAAQKLDLEEAEVYVKHFADRARHLAEQAVRAAIGGLQEMGYEVIGCGLPVMGVKEKDLTARGATDLGFSLDDLRLRLAEMGRPVGPPWGQDQKVATLVAWLALAAYERKHPRQILGN